MALVERAKRLDDDAWRILYDRHYARLYGYLYYRLYDPDLAEEYTAQVFEKAVRSIGQFHYRGVSLGAWLTRIAKNIATDHHRRAKTRPPDPLELNEMWIDSGDDPAQKMLSNESTKLLEQALKQLTPDQQHVILLRFVAQMTSSEAGKVLGKSPGAVKALQHRALGALRRELEALGYHGLTA